MKYKTRFIEYNLEASDKLRKIETLEIIYLNKPWWNTNILWTLKVLLTCQLAGTAVQNLKSRLEQKYFWLAVYKPT